MRSLVTAIFLSAFCAGAVSAGADEPIPPEDWRAMTKGKTLYYFKDGNFSAGNITGTKRMRSSFASRTGFVPKGSGHMTVMNFASPMKARPVVSGM